MAVDLPDGEATARSTDLAASQEVASVDMDFEADAEADQASSQAERLSKAVRLTREAVQAWADVIQDNGDEAQPAF